MKSKLIMLCCVLLASSCSSNLNFNDSYHKSVVVTMKNGKAFEGYVSDVDNGVMKFILKNSEKATDLKESDILNIMESENYYDEQGYEITEEAIDKEIGTRSRVLYTIIGAIGGGLIGGFSANAIDNTDTNLPTTTAAVGGGVGAVAGFLC